MSEPFSESVIHGIDESPPTLAKQAIECLMGGFVESSPGIPEFCTGMEFDSGSDPKDGDAIVIIHIHQSRE